MLYGDEPFLLQLAIGGGNSVEVDAQIRSELPHRRQGSAFRQLPAGDQFFDSIRHLLVDGTGIAGIDREEHRMYCVCILYTLCGRQEIFYTDLNLDRVNWNFLYTHEQRGWEGL